MDVESTYTAFDGPELIASGNIGLVLKRTKAWVTQHPAAQPLFFEDQTGKQLDFDLRGSTPEVLARLASHPAFTPSDSATTVRTGPGRPKLGVVSREVSLLPRHWAFLEQQPTGISAALRRLVEAASKHAPEKQRVRLARDAASRFMTAMAGNLVGFEEASRALFANNHAELEARIASWPRDIRRHLIHLIDVATKLDAGARSAAQDPDP